MGYTRFKVPWILGLRVNPTPKGFNPKPGFRVSGSSRV